MEITTKDFFRAVHLAKIHAPGHWTVADRGPYKVRVESKGGRHVYLDVSESDWEDGWMRPFRQNMSQWDARALPVLGASLARILVPLAPSPEIATVRLTPKDWTPAP